MAVMGSASTSNSNARFSVTARRAIAETIAGTNPILVSV